MVQLNIVKESNARLNAAGFPKVSVFIGATSGIGQKTIAEFVETGISAKVYIVGRPSALERTQAYIEELNKINPDVEIIWVGGEISILRDVQRICNEIRSKETSLDLLFISSGDLPFNGRTETSEGIDVSMSVQYYSRITFILNLLPLLQASTNPRVISIKGGGMERDALNLEDLGLKQPGSFGAISVQMHIVGMNTLMMEKLSEENKDITFIHSTPGQVYTGNNMSAGVSEYSLAGWLMRLVVRPLSQIIGLSPKESAQRSLFLSTSALYGSRGVETELSPILSTKGETGHGLFLVNQYNERTDNEKVLSVMRKNGQEKVWEHTKATLKPYL